MCTSPRCCARGFCGAAHRAFLPAPPPVAPARQGGEAQGSQPPEHRGVGLPRPGDDRRHFLDHGRPVRGCCCGGERCWARRGVGVVLVRAAAASPTKVASVLTLIDPSAWKGNSQKFALDLLVRNGCRSALETVVL